jgi:spermidine/putrescine transport system substrate-binding protein
MGLFGSDTAKDVLVSGDAAAGMIYNGFSAKARAEGANVEYAYPKEGFVVWMDNVVLLKDAPNRDKRAEVHELPAGSENAAAVTNYAAYTSGVTGRRTLPRRGDQDQPGEQPARGCPAGPVRQACDEETQALRRDLDQPEEVTPIGAGRTRHGLLQGAPPDGTGGLMRLA